MGIYTTNYQLYTPTVGETGWGTLVNGNFTTIDTTMKSLSNRITAVENEVNGNLSCTSVTTSSTITSTGKITGNGGIGTTSLTTSSTITSTGLITANGGVKGVHYVPAVVGTSGDETYATLAKQTLTITAQDSKSAQSITGNNYVKSYSTPKKHCVGVYTRASDLTGSPINPSVSSRRLTVKWYANSAISGDINIFFWYKKSTDASFTRQYFRAANSSYTAGALIDTLLDINVPVGTTYQFYINSEQYNVIAEYAAGTTYKVKYAT